MKLFGCCTLASLLVGLAPAKGGSTGYPQADAKNEIPPFPQEGWLRLMHYNLEKDVADSVGLAGPVKEKVQKLHPDVVALQGVTIEGAQLERELRALGYTHQQGQARQDGSGRVSMIFSKSELTTILQEDAGHDGAIHAVSVRNAGQPVAFVVLTLNGSVEQARQFLTTRLASKLDPYGDRYLVGFSAEGQVRGKLFKLLNGVPNLKGLLCFSRHSDQVSSIESGYCSVGLQDTSGNNNLFSTTLPNHSVHTYSLLDIRTTASDNKTADAPNDKPGVAAKAAPDSGAGQADASKATDFRRWIYVWAGGAVVVTIGAVVLIMACRSQRSQPILAPAGPNAGK